MVTFEIDEKLEVGAGVLGVVAAIGAAYYAGATGNATPLLVLAFGLGFLVLFVDSE